jgi:hypothetical protein
MGILGRGKRRRAFRAARFISADASLKLSCSRIPNRMTRLILGPFFAHGDAPLSAPAVALAIFSGEMAIPASERFVERFLTASMKRAMFCGLGEPLSIAADLPNCRAMTVPAPRGESAPARPLEAFAHRPAIAPDSIA